MKAHRRTFHRKSRFPLVCKKWTTSFGTLRKLCFPRWHSLQLNIKKHTGNTAACIRRIQGHLSRQHRVHLLHRKQVSATGLHLKKKKAIASYISSHRKLQRRRSSLKEAEQNVFLKDETVDQYLAPINKGSCSPFNGINSENKLGKETNRDTPPINSQADIISSLSSPNLPIKRVPQSQEWVESDPKILTVLNGNKKISQAVGQNLALKLHTCKSVSNKFQCSKKRSFFFMMYRKLSMIKFRCRIKPHFRARNKTVKVRKSNRSFFQKVFSGFGEKFKARLEPEVCNLFACLTVTNNPIVQNPHKSPDMNSNKSSLCETKECIPDGYSRTQSVKLQCSERHPEGTELQRQDVQDNQHSQITTSGWEYTESVATEEVDVAPVVNNCLSDIFVLVTDKDNETVACKGDPNTPVHVSGEQSALEELVGRLDNSCQMEVDECTDTDVFSTKLPFKDHLYCKRPHEEPLSDNVSVASEKQAAEIQPEKQEGKVKNGPKITSLVPDHQLTVQICGFLNEMMKKYGSLIPLNEKDVLARLKEVFNEDFSNRKAFITKEIMKFRAKHTKVSMCNFRVFYNKHMLDMDDLATLDGQNWLNDQVINMYGELIMDAVPDKVHFFNSFFHRQLVTKGYNGVKRWTKKVDLFKKTLLLIPIHLEVHWSLITVNLPDRIISFYDSQGIHFKFCVENIRKYLTTEAREKNNPEFLQGWQTAVTQCIPQQKNDSDCGVFVLQYCKCLALGQPFQFSQEDMPRVRKRIYKELCECRLMD